MGERDFFTCVAVLSTSAGPYPTLIWQSYNNNMMLYYIMKKGIKIKEILFSRYLFLIIAHGKKNFIKEKIQQSRRKV